MGKFSRDKGARFEIQIVHLMQEAGFAAEKVPLSGAAGGSFSGDISMPLLGVDVRIECKKRARGFTQIYDWIESNYGLVVAADRKPPLIVNRLDQWLVMAMKAGINMKAEIGNVALD